MSEITIEAWDKASLDSVFRVDKLTAAILRADGIKGEWELCRRLKAQAQHFGLPWGDDNTDRDLGL